MAYELLPDDAPPTKGAYTLVGDEPKKPKAVDRMDAMTMGLADPIHGGAQLVTKMLPDSVVSAGNRANNWLADKTGLVAKIPEGGVDQMTREREAAYQQRRKDSGAEGFDWMRLAGNVASPVNLAVSAAAPARAASLTGRMAQGAGMGAASGAMAPATGDGDYTEEKLKQMGIGGVAGGALPAVAAGLGRLISPKASTNPDIALLMKEGVRPTIGQTLGGFANRVEEKAQSLPIVGDAITWARGRAQGQFNEAALNRAGAPVGAKAEGVGHDGVVAVGDKISAAYNAAKAQLGNFQIDRQGARELTQLNQMAKGLPSELQRTYTRMLETIKTDISPNGTIAAESFKRIDSKLGKEAARFAGSTDAYQQQLGDALKELQRVITANAMRANPQAAKAVSAADEAWANLVRVEGATKAAMNNGGTFTPAQLQTAVRQADNSVRDRATARGTALMQDLSGAGQRVLGNKVPDSGTAGRMAIGTGALGAGFYSPAIPLGLAGAAATYAPPVQALLRSLVLKRPELAQSVAGLLDYSAPMLSPTGGLLAVEAVNR